MATKKNTITRDKIVSMYMNYRLENTDKPKSVHLFSKGNGFDEATFYSFFGTLESIEKEIYKLFIEKTLELIQKDPAYENYDMKNKLLSFYFTLFEIMTANRSYVLMNLKEHSNQLKNLMVLSGFKVEFKNPADSSMVFPTQMLTGCCFSRLEIVHYFTTTRKEGV